MRLVPIRKTLVLTPISKSEKERRPNHASRRDMAWGALAGPVYAAGRTGLRSEKDSRLSSTLKPLAGGIGGTVLANAVGGRVNNPLGRAVIGSAGQIGGTMLGVKAAGPNLMPDNKRKKIFSSGYTQPRNQRVSKSVFERV